MFLERLRHTMNLKRLHKEDIKAVHDDDLKGFLSSLGLLHDVKSGKIKCKFCHERLNLDSVQLVLPDSGSINIVCNREQCIMKYLDYSERAR